MRAGRLFLAVVLPAALLATSCRKKGEDQAMTAAEAQQALEEVAISGEAESVTSGAIEIATDFTIGQAVEAAAQEVRDFIASQLPCAEVTLSGSTLTIEYGVNPGNCTYRGHTYSGSHSVTISRNDSNEVLVQHSWDALSNGRVSVTGSADVTWDFDAQTRHVVHELEWTRMSDGRTGTGSGDRMQTVLPGGLEEGIQIDGSRAWEGQAGRWDLVIDGVEVRWADPVPQAGSYTLASPRDRTISMSFTRIDEDTIRVTISSGTKSFSFNVTKTGGISGN
jgi:hypothetical protein